MEKLTADLPGLWHAFITTNEDRKQPLRTLMADVTLPADTDRGAPRIGICWRTGAYDELQVARPCQAGSARPWPWWKCSYGLLASLPNLCARTSTRRCCCAPYGDTASSAAISPVPRRSSVDRSTVRYRHFHICELTVGVSGKGLTR